MKKSQMRKLARIISELDKIILAETEQTGLIALKKCRDNLQEVLLRLKGRKRPLDSKLFIVSILRLIECVHFFVTGKNL